MILTDLGPITAYRMHVPRWSSMPTSGAGAALHGGRANRPGTTGAKGLLFASTLVPGGRNLVIYNHTLEVGDLLEVYDPGKTLPENQDSWPSTT
jgi:RES domain-containing protein